MKGGGGPFFKGSYMIHNIWDFSSIKTTMSAREEHSRSLNWISFTAIVRESAEIPPISHNIINSFSSCIQNRDDPRGDGIICNLLDLNRSVCDYFGGYRTMLCGIHLGPMGKLLSILDRWVKNTIRYFSERKNTRKNELKNVRAVANCVKRSLNVIWVKNRREVAKKSHRRQILWYFCKFSRGPVFQ